MFIHSLSEWPFGLPYVMVSRCRTVNDVDQITEFICNLCFKWEVLALKFFWAQAFYLVHFFKILVQ